MQRFHWGLLMRKRVGIYLRVSTDGLIFIAFAIALGVMPMALLVGPIFLK